MRSDLESCLELLHSIVGLSGEAGAVALHRMAKQIYIQMSQDQRLPGDLGWTDTLHALAAESAEALNKYTAGSSAV